MKALQTTKAKAVLVLAAISALVLAFGAQFAAAEGPEYSKLTSGVTSEFDTIIPIVLTAIGLLLGITFAIKWAVRKFGGMH